MMERMGAGGWRPEPVHGNDGELVEIVLIRDDSVTPPTAADGHPLASGVLRDRWIGNPLPELDLVTLDGTVLGAAEIEDKVVVLNFWFRACKPCLMEIPELNELVEAFENDEVVFLAVTFDNEEQTREVLAENPFAYHIVTDGQHIHEQFTIESYPTHLVFGADGRCTAALSGYTPGIGRMLEHEIRAALEATG
jgi:peroxiredoxin